MAPRIKQEKNKAAAAPKKTPTKKEPAKKETAAPKKEEAIVKTEPGSSSSRSSSSKEVIQASRGALSALITSLKHQTKAKKATEEHKAAAQKILDEFCLHS